MNARSVLWWPGLLARTVITLVVLLWLSQHWGHYYVEALLSLYRAVLDLALSDYAVLDINTTIQMVSSWWQPIFKRFIHNKSEIAYCLPALPSTPAHWQAVP